MKKIILYSLICIGNSCIEPYEPPVTEDDINFLVVDGFVNSSSGSAEVTLSRAIALSDDFAFPSENNANVFLEEEAGLQYALPEVGPGKYSASGLAIDESKKYRLLITTSDGENYDSDFISLLSTPQIDSVSWIPTADAVEINVSTHDQPGVPRYFKWDFDETWLYTAPFHSSFILDNGSAIYRSIDEQIYECYKTLPSTKIILASTEQQVQNVISSHHLLSIDKGSEKTRYKYSVLVKQQTLGKEAFEYWRELQKITESLGGLFDPLPSSLSGNIYSTSNPDEKVLGYFSGGQVSEKRIFIAFTDLPEHLQFQPHLSNCEQYRIDVELLSTLGPTSLLTSQITVGIVVVGYYFSSHPCADCRLQGGTTAKPAFWP